MGKDKYPNADKKGYLGIKIRFYSKIASFLNVKSSKLKSCTKEKVEVARTVLIKLAQTEISIYAYYPMREIKRGPDSYTGIETAKPSPHLTPFDISVLKSLPRCGNITRFDLCFPIHATSNIRTSREYQIKIIRRTHVESSH